MIKFKGVKFAGLLSVLILLNACVTSKPVEMQQTVDDRPLIFFTNEGTRVPSVALGVYVDNLYMGDARELLDEQKGLAVLPGTHMVEIREGKKTVIKQKIYVGSGSSKTLPITLD